MHIVNVGPYKVGPGQPLLLMAGPCVLEGYEHSLAIGKEAKRICEKLGIDLPTYMRICIARLVQENGIPFSMKIENNDNPGIDALKRANRIAKEYGTSDMPLDEINAEIAEARKQASE